VSNVVEWIQTDAPTDKKDIKKLQSEISDYLETMVEENLRNFMRKRYQDDRLQRNTNDFFRKRDRYRSTKKLLQYLIRIIDNLPEGDVKKKINASHFFEFKKLVSFQAELMQEGDVLTAMTDEFQEMSRVNKINLWYYKGQMRSAYNEISELIRQADNPVPADYHKLFNALIRISSFWFYVRGDDVRRVRITDVYIYKLLQILISRFPEN